MDEYAGNMADHGSAFRVRAATHPAVAHYPPGATFGPRTMRDLEFVWVLSGSARWQAGAETVELTPGVLLLVTPGSADSFAWDPRSPTTHGYVHFEVESAPPAGGRRDWPRIRRLTMADPMAALCAYLLRLGSQPTAPARARVDSVLGLLLDLFVAGPLPGEEPGAELPGHLARSLDHLRMAWPPVRAVPVAELAAAGGLSVSHLSRLTRQWFGLGPAAMVELLRLARAATLLQRSNLPVRTVAQACGFVDPLHFSKRFRRAYGLPPRDYRGRPALDPLEPLERRGLRWLADDPATSDQVIGARTRTS
jgi:AraC-like DNA-binding protein